MKIPRKIAESRRSIKIKEESKEDKMSNSHHNMQIRLSSPPKLKKGYSYEVWESEFRGFVERTNPELYKMYTEEGYNQLPSQEDAMKMLENTEIDGGKTKEEEYKLNIKLNNEAQLLLRCAMDKSTKLIRILEHRFGERATKLDTHDRRIPSAYHQKLYLDERYGRGKGITELDADQFK